MTFSKIVVYFDRLVERFQFIWKLTMDTKRIKTIGIKAAAYDIIKKVSEERKNSTKPDGICDIASEAIEKAFGKAT